MEPINERRQSQRVLFEKQHKIMGHFSLLEKQDKSIVVQILNISLGGISFTLRSNRDIELKVGDRIIFEEIVNQDSHVFPIKMRARIVWIMEDSAMEYTGIGSKFLDMNSERESIMNDCIQHCQLANDIT